jgi:hypothetical protein
VTPFEQVRGTPVPCARPGCGHTFVQHATGGGSCAEPCDCPGFRWVPAQGPPHGYSGPPRWS